MLNTLWISLASRPGLVCGFHQPSYHYSQPPVMSAVSGIRSCEVEPIHIIPAVQQCGAALLVVYENQLGEYEIVAASDNTESCGNIGAPAASLIGRDCRSLFDNLDQVATALVQCASKVTASQQSSEEGWLWWMRAEERGCTLLQHTLSGSKLNTEECLTIPSLETIVDLANYGEGRQSWWEQMGYTMRDHEATLRSQATQSDTQKRTVICRGSIRGSPVEVVIIGSTPKCFLLEIETSGADHTCEVADNILADLNNILHSSTEDEVYRRVIDVVSFVTGFERVMVYLFDPAGDGDDGYGEVVAEKCSQEHIRSFLGLKFPATDIPRQARAIYKRTLVRSIYDVDAAPVPLIKAPALNAKPIDLSDSRLRYASPIHNVYLRNMGVTASASASIVLGTRLHGLLACHHTSGPKAISTTCWKWLQLISAHVSMAVSNICAARRGELAAKIRSSPRGRSVAATFSNIVQPTSDFLTTDFTVIIAQKQGQTVDIATADLDQLDVSVHGDATQSEVNFVVSRLRHLAADTMLSNEVELFFFDKFDKIVELVSDKGHAFEGHIETLNRIGGIAVTLHQVFLIGFVRHTTTRNQRYCGVEPTADGSFRNIENIDAVELPAAKRARTDESPGPVNEILKNLLPRRSFVEFNDVHGSYCPGWSSDDRQMIKHVGAWLAQTIEYFTVALERDRARAAEQMARNFLANMSHELRTPFNGVVGMLSVLLDDDSIPSDAVRILNVINRSAEGMLSLLDDILTISKLERKRFKLVFDSFSIERLIADVCELFRARAVEAGINLSSSYEAIDARLPASPYLVSDGGRLRQIIVNLTSNAIKFSRAGTTVSLQVTLHSDKNRDLLHSDISRARRKHFFEHRPVTQIVKELEMSASKVPPSPDGSPEVSSHATSSREASPSGERMWLLCSVADEGVGISQDSMCKLFRRFSQVDDSKTRPYQGTGLGLAICDHLVRLLGGRIWCFSSQGTHSRSIFQCCVPVHLDPREFPESRAGESAETSYASSQRGVDDVAHDTFPPSELIQDGNMSQSEEKDTCGISDTSLSRRASPKQATSHIGSSNVLTLATAPGDIAKLAAIDNKRPQTADRTHSSPLSAMELARLKPESQYALARCNNQPILLAVDDMETNRSVLAVILRRIPGYHVMLGEDGQAAVDACDSFKSRVAFVFLDWHMPRVDGIQAARIIRTMPGLSAVKLVLVTADLTASEDAGLSALFDNVVVKPISSSKIVAIVQPPAAA